MSNTNKATESFTQKIKRFDQTIEEGVKAGLPANLSGLSKTGLFLDFMREYVFHGAYLLDYIQYGFYWKNRRERERYVVHGKLLEMMKICTYSYKPLAAQKLSRW